MSPESSEQQCPLKHATFSISVSRLLDKAAYS
jgi:hypothetical protein